MAMHKNKLALKTLMRFALPLGAAPQISPYCWLVIRTGRCRRSENWLRQQGLAFLSSFRAKGRVWYDHESSEGGDLSILIRRERGGAFANALEFARGFVGSTASSSPTYVHSAVTGRHQETNAARSNTAQFAASIWNASVDPRGTVVEAYLKSRNLEIPDCVAGDAVGFLQAVPLPWPHCRRHGGALAPGHREQRARRNLTDIPQQGRDQAGTAVLRTRLQGCHQIRYRNQEDAECRRRR